MTVPATLSESDFERLRRFVTDGADAPDRAATERWIAADPARRHVHDELAVLWSEAGRLVPSVDVGAAHARFVQHLETMPRRRGVTRTRAWYTPTAIGAALLIAIAVALPVLRRGVSSSSVGTTTRVYRTAAAQRADVRMPDGTQATLAPATTLTYAEAPNGARYVTLDGQAKFVVTHGADRPFVVDAAGVATRVLGTTFAVRAYATDALARIVVADGRVEVGTGTDTRVLARGDVALGHTQSALRVSHTADVHALMAWTSGTLVLADLPLRDAIPELERTYDVEIRLTSPELATRYVSATLVNASVDVMLSTVAPAIDATVRRDGRVITFSARASGGAP